MAFKEFKVHLGVGPDSPCLFLTPDKTPKLNQRRRSKVLSFLSDSCYLSSSPSPCGQGNSSAVESVSESSESEMSEIEEEEEEEAGDLVEQFSAQRLSSGGSSSATSPIFDLHPHPLLEHEELEPQLYSLQCEEDYSHGCAVTFKPVPFRSSPFPQPTFSDCESDSESEGSPEVNPKPHHPLAHSSYSFDEGMDTTTDLHDHNAGFLSCPPPAAQNHYPLVPSHRENYPSSGIPDFELSEPLKDIWSLPKFHISGANSISNDQENLRARERTVCKIRGGRSSPSRKLQRSALRQVDNIPLGHHSRPASGVATTRPQASPSLKRRRRQG